MERESLKTVSPLTHYGGSQSFQPSVYSVIPCWGFWINEGEMLFIFSFLIIKAVWKRRMLLSGLRDWSNHLLFSYFRFLTYPLCVSDSCIYYSRTVSILKFPPRGHLTQSWNMDSESAVNELLLQSKGIIQTVDFMKFIWVCFDAVFWLTAPLLQLVCFFLPSLLQSISPFPSTNTPLHLKCIRILSQLIYPVGHLRRMEIQSKGCNDGLFILVAY